MRLNSATMFLASMMMDDDEFLEAIKEWKDEVGIEEEQEEQEESEQA